MDLIEVWQANNHFCLKKQTAFNILYRFEKKIKPKKMTNCWANRKIYSHPVPLATRTQQQMKNKTENKAVCIVHKKFKNNFHLVPYELNQKSKTNGNTITK